jgi:hypothetical protein
MEGLRGEGYKKLKTKNFMNKKIKGTEYVVYEAGMPLDDVTKSIYFSESVEIDGDVKCLHLYAVKDVVIHGNQHVRGDQDVRGNQYVRGYQDVRGYQHVGGNQYVGGYQDVRGYQHVGGNQYVGGYQDVRGYQYVRYVYLHLYCKWAIRIDRDTNNIKIGCIEKTELEWVDFFEKKQKISEEPGSRNYNKLASAFNIARQMKSHLILMNDKNEP